MDLVEQEIYRTNPTDPKWKQAYGQFTNVLNELNPIEQGDMILQGRGKQAILPVIIAQLSPYELKQLEKAIADFTEGVTPNVSLPAETHQKILLKLEEWETSLAPSGTRRRTQNSMSHLTALMALQQYVFNRPLQMMNALSTMGDWIVKKGKGIQDETFGEMLLNNPDAYVFLSTTIGSLKTGWLLHNAITADDD